jgi:hypothetical protein
LTGKGVGTFIAIVAATAGGGVIWAGFGCVGDVFEGHPVIPAKQL